MAAKGTIYGINGPIVYIAGDSGFQMNEMVYVGEANLVGEVIGLTSERTTIEVYEETTGLKPGEPVTGTGAPVSVTLAPGIITNIFDGIERPLAAIKKSSGYYIDRGVHVTSLDTEKKWQTHMTVKRGDHVYGGTIIAEVPETRAITHKVMIPPDLEGDVLSVVSDGEYTINDTLLTIMTKDGTEKAITMTQKWPIRIPRPTVKRYPASKPLITGQRILDTLFPLAKGGTAAIPGGFGTGKTMTQHQIAKWSDADIIIYIGCGERGNEMTQVLEEFGELIDPKTGNPLMDRTTLIANTSNMPVAAREASVYTAMTMAEFYRAMGLKVLLMADSTSRWAQALREMSNRMEELPGPDAFPMDISAIISNFYGRAGFVHLYNGATGSITFIGTVSPAGGNLKEPVTENTKKVARCFYALEQERADRKRYPAVNPIDSYSKYLEYPEFEDYITERINNQWTGKVNELKTRLLRGKEIAEQINILGDDGVPVEYHVIFWKSELIDFVILQQDAFDEVDSVTPMERQEDIVNMVIDICHTNFKFETFVEVMDYFKKMINICKQMNYSKYKSEQYEDFRKQLATLVAERSVK